MLGVLMLDATGVRLGELEAAQIGDLDEERGVWLIRASVSKTRRARWVDIPADLLDVVLDRLPVREDRDPTTPLFRAGVIVGGRLGGVRFLKRLIRAVRIAAVDKRIPRPLRWLAALGLLPIPGPFDEAVLIVVAIPLALLYRGPLKEAWRESDAKHVRTAQTPVQTSPVEIAD